MRPLCLLSLFVLLAGQLTSSFAQVVVPDFVVRGEVGEPLQQAFMTAFREELALATRERIVVGDLVTRGVAGSLAPELIEVIAQVGQGEYGISGQIRGADVRRPGALAPGEYSVTVLVGNTSGQTSDLISQALTLGNVRESARSLAAAVAEFVKPARLLAGNASVWITSEPSEAEIYINGTYVGLTSELQPLDLAPGRYEMVARKEGFLPETVMLDLEAEQIEFTTVVLTENRIGAVQLSSEPRAQAFLDGRLVGTTPLTVRALPGEHQVRLERPGFEPEIVSTTVKALRVSRVPVLLTPRFDPMLYWEAPPGTLVLIDNQTYSQGFLGDLSPGEHRVEVREGSKTLSFSIQVPSSGVYRIDFEARALKPHPTSP